MPFGKKPPLFHKCANEAFSPEEGSIKPVNTKNRPTTTSSKMAMILINANQNSISPNSFTVSRFMPAIIKIHKSPGSHSGTSGHQNCV